LVIAALAGVQWIWTSDRQTVIYLLDQSDSIPLAKRQLMLRYAVESVKKFRRTSNNRNDRAGLIIFGREASIEIPPLDENLPPLNQPESYLGKTDATNIEGALKLAAASFLEDSSVQRRRPPNVWRKPESASMSSLCASIPRPKSWSRRSMFLATCDRVKRWKLG
jgi:hypothetical protein